MGIGLAILSIILFTGLVFFLRKIFKLKVCAICAGVTLTWLWLLLARLFGLKVDFVVLAMLMGASVAGLSELLGKKVAAGPKRLFSKSFLVLFGFLAVYFVIANEWLVAVFPLASFAAIAFWLITQEKSSATTPAHHKKLKDELEDCC